MRCRWRARGLSRPQRAFHALATYSDGSASASNGTGKTLAAFLDAIDGLLEQGRAEGAG